jgi:hypothetical protein
MCEVGLAKLLVSGAKPHRNKHVQSAATESNEPTSQRTVYYSGVLLITFSTHPMLTGVYGKAYYIPDRTDPGLLKRRARQSSSSPDSGQHHSRWQQWLGSRDHDKAMHSAHSADRPFAKLFQASTMAVYCIFTKLHFPVSLWSNSNALRHPFTAYHIYLRAVVRADEN